MKTVYRQTWVEVELSEVKDKDVIKFTLDGDVFTVDGEPYEENGELVIETLEDCVEED